MESKRKKQQNRFLGQNRKNFLRASHPSALHTQQHPQAKTGSSEGQHSQTGEHFHACRAVQRGVLGSLRSSSGRGSAVHLLSKGEGTLLGIQVFKCLRVKRV